MKQHNIKKKLLPIKNQYLVFCTYHDYENMILTPKSQTEFSSYSKGFIS